MTTKTARYDSLSAEKMAANVSLAQDDYLRRIAEQVKAAEWGQRSALIADAAAFLGRSQRWVYRQLRELGAFPKRCRRADAGTVSLDKEEAAAVSNLLLQSSRDNGKKLLSTRDALYIAEQNGLIKTSNIAPQTALRALQEHSMHPKQLGQQRPYTRLRSKHPNHVWQFDVSVCVLYYLRSGQGVNLMPQHEFYKNKPGNVERIANDRVLRYLVVDHYSGAFYVEYFEAPGENARTLFEFLLNAFEKRHPKDPFHGLPFCLQWDAGTANQSHMIEHWLNSIGVKTLTHMPGNPRAKGLVERTHDLIETGFEGRLAFMAVESLEQLNENRRCAPPY